MMYNNFGVGQMSISARFSGYNQSSVSRAAKADKFQEQLAVLKQEMTLERLRQDKTEDADKTTDQNQDSLAAGVGDGQLFSAWDSNLSVDEALQQLDSNLSRIGAFSLSSKIEAQEAIEHLASQYSVYKDYISKSGSSDQRKQLDKIMEKHIDKYAREFSEVIGGFFEDNGLSGERQCMYEAVKERIQTLSQDYDDYISKNQADYNRLFEEAQQGKSCLAFDLRKAYKADGDMERFYRYRDGGYTREELSEAVRLVKVANLLMGEGEAEAVSEEELGVKLGTIALKGLAFLETSKARGKHKETFQNAVYSRVTELMDESDALLAEKSENAQDERAYQPLDRTAVKSIIETMVEAYTNTHSFSRALTIGQEEGLQLYCAKADENSAVIRYRNSSYWRGVAEQFAAGKKRDVYKRLNISLLNVKA